MKRSTLAVIALAAILTASPALAQNCTGTGPRGQGKGYGGPPRSTEERAARQATCLEKNGGVCPQGGPRLECQGAGQGKAQGRGNGQANGLRDGTGPRNANAAGTAGNKAQPGGSRR